MTNVQEVDEDDSAYLGVQGQAGVSGFYVELLEKISQNILNRSDSGLSRVENPENSLSLLSKPGVAEFAQPNIVVGGGFQDFYEKYAEDPDRKILGVRGFLTLNRLPSDIEANAVVGEIALLASKLDFELAGTSKYIYVSSAVEPPQDSLFDELKQLGFDLVSLDEGLERVSGAIKGAELVIADGVVGLAIADGFRVPNVWHNNSSSPALSFQIKDYLLGVGRAPNIGLLSIPGDISQIWRKSRVADLETIDRHCRDLVRVLEIASKFAPSHLIESEVQLTSSTELPPFVSGESNQGRLEFEYSYYGQKERRQVLVSFDLYSQDGTDISELDEIPKLLKSQREEIGFFRYLTLEDETGTKELRYALPAGIYCRGIRLFKWAEPESVISMKSIVHTMIH